MFTGCTKVSRGKTDFCAAHGGGTRCTIKNCNKLAMGNQSLCRQHNMQMRTQMGLEPADNYDVDADDNDMDDASF